MRVSKTNIGFLGFFEKIIRSHPLIYFICRSLIRFTNIFERDFDGLKKINFKKNINIIDIGASDGIAVKFFNKNLNVNKIICFEPYEKYIKILKKYKNLIIYPYAIGDKNISKRIYFPRYNLFGKSIDLITYAHYDYNLLQHFIKDFGYKNNLSIESSILKVKKIVRLKYKIDLIKIDTNGYELNVILGLLKLIKKDKPVLIVEINKDEKKISNILSKYNYNALYFSVKRNCFTKKKEKNSTNKYFIQNKMKIKNNFHH